ncbi:hypothetical protein V494_00044 [Pseudogymnoascus sp. VKM F-4513 (FW-928)]|nr:hypothetical protein V494_00044 [Pseudogymnoascus sp. VKM F-4513 (FW-928)]
MIDPSDRFWVVGEQVMGNLHTGQVIDWDQRRWYTVKGPLSLIPPDGDVDIDILKRYVGQLGQTVQSITVDDKGLLIKVSSDPEDDRTLTTNYPRLAAAPSLQDCLTVQLSQLTEEDRFGPNVDLVSYMDGPSTSNLVVFKYFTIYQTRPYIWNELHLTKSLPKHPNILPFDRVVVSGAESRVVGFTTPYIPNGTIEQNKDRIFKISWLQQLLDVVDYLNFDLGIVHQDIAPRNLLIDPKTDRLLLFDFDRAAHVGGPRLLPERNDVSGVIFTLYEIVSRDDHFRRVEHQEQDPNEVLILESWPVKCQLDCEVGEFRKLLNEWVQRRKRQDAEPPKNVDFTPDIPDEPPASPIIIGTDDSGEPIWGDDLIQRRQDALKSQKLIISWERPPVQLAPIE